MVKISDAEYEVMKVIWKRKEATSLEIINDLSSFSWNYNTIRTLIKRLHTKGAIEIIRKNGKTYTYAPVIDEKKYRDEATRDLIKKLYNNSVNEFVCEYCQADKSSIENLKEVIKIVDEREEKEREKNKNKDK